MTDEYVGSACKVTITGIRAGVCSHCGRQAVDADTLEEIEMFVGPLLGGQLGMRLLPSAHLTIDLGHSLHPSAIDIAGAFQDSFSQQYLSQSSLQETGAGVGISEEAA